LSSKCTRFTTEFGIIFVITIFALDNEGTIGEEWIILASCWEIRTCEIIRD
jgi:hypothetical protein